MIVLRLFESANPFHQIAERRLEDRELTMGTDPSADWVIEDAHGDLSRKHCVLIPRGSETYLMDTSTNGTTLGPERSRINRGEAVQLATGESFNLGRYMILVDGQAAEDLPGLPHAVSSQLPRPAFVPATDAGLLERFCMGAGLEASSFAGEDPSDVMTRLGEVYRQVVDDLCHLMRDRALLKDQLHMDRTTISARDNNPLKWAPPHRIAVELLQEGESGFLKGAAAFRASFADIRLHGAALMSGSRAAVSYVLDQLDPDALEQGVKRQPLAFTSRHEALWRRYREEYAALAGENSDSPSGGVGRALRSGYEQYLAAADEIPVS